MRWRATATACRPMCMPVAVNEVTQVGLETIAAAFAYGATAIRFLLRARAAPRCRRDSRAPSRWPSRSSPGSASARAASPRSRPTIPMRSAKACAPSRRASRRRRRRASCRSAASATCSVWRLRELHRAAPAPVDVIALPAGAPFGAVEVNVEGCTLCLACVSACPTGALSADPERPMLRFSEDACVQCGLCKATCPEKVITLEAAARFPRRHRVGARAQGRGAVPLHPLRQAVRREEHDRARHRQARRQALDVQGPGAAARRPEDVRGLPRGRGDRAGVRSVRRRRNARSRAPPRTICASARQQASRRA